MVKINFSSVPFGDKITIKRCLCYALRYLGQPNNIVISVNYVNKEQIHALNVQNRGIDNPTDVLSFPFLEVSAGEVIHTANYVEDIDLSTGRLLLGEMYLCKDIAIAQAAEYGHSVKREVAFLCLHSLLHLLGYDHQTDDDEKQMERIQETILTKLGIKR